MSLCAAITPEGINQMKHIITAAIIALASPAWAEEPKDKCLDLGELAQTMMEHRQAGTAISTLVPYLNGNKAATSMLVSAYEEPRYNSDEYQTRSIQDFRNKWETACYMAQSD